MTTAERIASALEIIASSVREPDADLVERVFQLDSIVRGFVELMKDPQSTNEAWADLFEDAKAALGMEEGVVQ